MLGQCARGRTRPHARLAWFVQFRHARVRRRRPLLERLAEVPQSLGVEDVAELAQFLGFQSIRGVAARDGSRDAAADLISLTVPSADSSDEQLMASFGRSGKQATPQELAELRDFLRRMESGSARMVPQDAMILGLSMKVAAEIGLHLLRRRWFVCDTPPSLITTDEPVVPIGGPGSERIDRAGAGTAGIVIFPLRPDRLLIMVRSDLTHMHPRSTHIVSAGAPIDHSELAELNRELAANAHRYTFELPTRSQGLLVKVPQTPGIAAQEDMTGKVVITGRESEEPEVIRSFRTTRWANTAHVPDWPVARWWPPFMLSPHEYLRANPHVLDGLDDEMER